MQRVEIITGKERRRRWADEEKRRLVAEAFGPGVIVAHVARRHGVAESCLYAWRKQFVGEVAGPVAAQHPALIPVMIERASAATTPTEPDLPRSGHAVIAFPDGTRVEIAAGYPAAGLKALIAALRQTR